MECVFAPCFVTQDFHGFVDADGDKVFVFASRGTGMARNSNRSGWIVQNEEDKKELIDYFKMSNIALLDTWYQKHVTVRNLEGSGFVPRRLVAMMVIIQPMNYGAPKEYN